MLTGIKRLPTLLLSLMALMANAQSWQGQAGTKRILITIENDSIVMLQSPEAGIHELVGKLIKNDQDSLVIDGSYGGSFSGKWQDNKKIISGKWTSLKGSRTLQFHAVNSLEPLHLLQAPQPPFPYQTEDVIFYNKDSSLQFGATLTLPPGSQKKTAIVLVSGTGPQDRNGTMAGHPWFHVLADRLSRAGYIVLRTDDRGVGKTTGSYANATTEDFANDALAAVTYLKTRKEVAPNRIGLLGHSEGGAAITIAAAKDSSIAFLISLSGLAMPGLQALKMQNELLIKNSPNSPAEKEAQIHFFNNLFDSVYHYADDSIAVAAAVNRTYTEWKATNDSIGKARNIPDHLSHFRFFTTSYIRQATGKWYTYHIRYNPASFLPAIHAPILALGGDKDVMVPAEINLENIKKWAGSKAITTVVFPGLNHLLQHCNRCTPDEYAELGETLSPAVMERIIDWLKKRKF